RSAGSAGPPRTPAAAWPSAAARHRRPAPRNVRLARWASRYQSYVAPAGAAGRYGRRTTGRSGSRDLGAVGPVRPAGQRASQSVRLQRFGKVVVHTRRQTGGAVLGEGVGGQGDDRRLVAARAQGA